MSALTTLRFRDLSIGDTFDFITGTMHDSFFDRCRKAGERKYESDSGLVYYVGSIDCFVFNVCRENAGWDGIMTTALDMGGPAL